MNAVKFYPLVSNMRLVENQHTVHIYKKKILDIMGGIHSLNLCGRHASDTSDKNYERSTEEST